jgi:hypothetical protein
MKTITLFILTLFVSLFSFGQIYTETFNGQGGKGAINETTDDLTGVTWTVDRSGQTYNAEYKFSVVSNQFNAIAVGTSTWLSPVIDISSHKDIGFTIVASRGSGNHLEVTDTVTTEYRIDDGCSGFGPWTQAAVNPVLSANFTGTTISQTGLIGNTLELRVTMKSTSGEKKEVHYIDDISVTGTSITKYTYNGGWSTDGDPSGVSSADDKIIIEAGDATISSNTNISKVTVKPGASLTIDVSAELTVTNKMTLESSSNSYSSLLLDGTIAGTGTIAYKRFVNSNTLGNDLISPPLTGETWSNFLNNSCSNATDLLDDGQTIPKTYAFAPFDKTADWYVNYTDAVNPNLESGMGYRAATDVGTTLTFTGTVPTGQVTVPITIETVAPTYPEWNLIGNPYPSYVDIAAFFNYDAGPGKNIDLLRDLSGIYGYDGTASNGWDVITLANVGTRLMTPGQGFLVPAKTASATITFDPSMRATGTDDDFIAGRDANTLTFLHLNASTATEDYSTQFYFNDNASQGLDVGYDAAVFGAVPAFSIYSLLVQDNT